jgi:hypothetical protein
VPVHRLARPFALANCGDEMRLTIYLLAFYNLSVSYAQECPLDHASSYFFDAV